MDAADREEIKAKFKKIDTNGDGKITRSKCASLLLDMFPHWSKEDTNELLDAVGTSADGVLDYCEFIDWVYFDDGEQATSPARVRRLEELFSEFDARQRGRLKDPTLFWLASKLGYDGDEEAFEDEYAVLCRTNMCRPFEGLDLRAFLQMTDNRDGDYYVDDKTLENLLEDLAARKQRLETIFKAMDSDNHGCLSGSDMFCLAEKLGFEAGKEEFLSHQYVEMSESYAFDRNRGLDLETFLHVCNDHEGNFFLEDENLEQLLADLPKKKPAAAAPKASRTTLSVPQGGATLSVPRAQPAGRDGSMISMGDLKALSTMDFQKWARNSHQETDASVSGRKTRCAKLFKNLDVKRGGRLKLPEMFRLAKDLEYPGDQADFEEEYEQLCGDMGCDPKEGLDTNQFFLATNFEDSGVYIDDEKLKKLIGEDVSPRTSPRPSPRGSPRTSPRGSPVAGTRG